MTTIEIITQPSPQNLSVEDMCQVVEEYIYLRKGKNVRINLEAKVPATVWEDFYMIQVSKLTAAFDVAAKWIISNQK